MTDIKVKIADELREEIRSERQVVYLLIDIRKLMEMANDANNYRSLSFHCDWIAHAVMDRAAAKRIVTLIDGFQEQVESKHIGPSTTTLVAGDFPGELGDIIRLSGFRTELGRYLSKEGIDHSLVENDIWWTKFLLHYIHIIEDCPLTCINKGLRFVEEVTVRVCDINAVTTKLRGCTLHVIWSWLSLLTGKETTKQEFY